MITLPPIQRSFNILVKATNATQTIIISPASQSQEKWGISPENCEIERRIYNLQLNVDLTDFPSQPYPDRLTNEFMNKFEENLVIRNDEWGATNKFIMELLGRPNPNADWVFKNKIALLNRDYIPYTHPDFYGAWNPNQNGYLVFGPYEEIGVRLVDTGAGLLRGGDKLTISGQYVETAYVREDSAFISQTENKFWSVTPEGIKLATLPKNAAWFYYRNNGTSRIWINYGTLSGIGFGESLEPGEATRLDNAPVDSYRWYGDIWAIAEGNSNQPMSGIVAYV